MTLLVVRFSRDLERYRYLLLLVGGILLGRAALLQAHSTAPGCGSTSAAFEFQPIEFSKLLLCIFFASYFASNKEMLSIPTARLGNRLVLDPRPLIPILVAWGVAMAVIGLEDDIGFAALLFVLFIGLLWITTGRVGYLVFGLRALRRRRRSSPPTTSARSTCGWTNGSTRGPRPTNSDCASQLSRRLVRHGDRWHRGHGAGPRRPVLAGKIPELTSRHDLRRHRHRDGHDRRRGRGLRLHPAGRRRPARGPDRPLGLLAA